MYEKMPGERIQDELEDELEEIAITNDDVESDSDGSEDEIDEQPDYNDSPDESIEMRPIHVYEKHTGSVVWCDINPLVYEISVTGGEDDKAFVWNINTRETIFEVSTHEDSVSHVAFNFDGSIVATGDMKGLIQASSIQDGAKIWSQSIPQMQWLMWHKTKNVLCAADGEGNIYFWKIPGTQCIFLSGYQIPTEVASFTPDGKKLVVCYDDGKIKVFEVSTRRNLVTYNPSKITETKATDIDILQEENCFVAAFTDKTIIVASTQTQKVYYMEEVEEIPECVKFVPSSTAGISPMIVYGSEQGLQIVDYSKKITRHVIDCEAINRIVYEPERKAVYAGSILGNVYVINPLSGQLIFKFVGRDGNIFDLKISGDGSRLLTACENGKCCVYDLTVLDRLLTQPTVATTYSYN